LTQFGKIGSVYPGFEIIIALGLQSPTLNRGQMQIFYCWKFFTDLLDDVVAVTDEQEQFLVNRIEIPGICRFPVSE
jgi:hypothetical protein